MAQVLLMLIFLSCEFKATGIPYIRRTDSNSHSYVRLKDHPEALDRLPEPNREPVLRESLQLFINSNSALESVGCETWETDDENIYDEANLVQVFRKGSYIALIFSDEQFGSQYSDWFDIFVMLAEALEGEPEQRQAMRVSFILKPFGMPGADRTGWQLELWIDARWRTREAARQLWEAYLRLVSKHLFEIANEYTRKLLETARPPITPTDNP